MFRFLICCFLLFNISSAFGAAYRVIQSQPEQCHNSYYQVKNYYNPYLSKKNLSALEKYTLNKTYPAENPISRLERLENLAFGSIQQGDLESRYENVETALLSRPNYYNNKKKRLGNVINYFTGQATGTTPPIYNNGFSSLDNIGIYNPSQNYGNQRVNQYSNGIFGHGFSLMNSGFGNGSSVTILP